MIIGYGYVEVDQQKILIHGFCLEKADSLNTAGEEILLWVIERCKAEIAILHSRDAIAGDFSVVSG